MQFEEALALAKKYNLEEEFMMEIRKGASPEEALEEWDL